MDPAASLRLGYQVAAPDDVQAACARADQAADVGQPRVLTWSQIEPDGTEHSRTGRVWSACAPVKVSGSRKALAYQGAWVRADHDDQWWCVLRAHRRTGVGRQRGARYRPGAGRVVEFDEWWTETHPDSATHRATQAARTRLRLPTVITVEPLNADVLASLSHPM